MTQSQPTNGSRFVFGRRPAGFEATITRNPAGGLILTVTLDLSKEGPPGHAHGGSLATLLDEAMGSAAWADGYQVLAANLNIDYMTPVPLNTPLTITGRVDRKEGRKVFTSGEILLPDGRTATRGTGLFIEAPDIFAGKMDGPPARRPQE
ncbi:MAG: PaaI family thioesterase [Chloroflexota bacterium]